jgi:hypothetical protein
MRTTLLLVLVLLSSVPESFAFPPDGQAEEKVEKSVEKAQATVVSPGDPAFDRRLLDHALQIEARSTDGRLVRSGSGVLTADSGYVMTSLDVVVGGSTYRVSGGVVGSSRDAAPLAVTRQGDIAILQLQMAKEEERLSQPPRTKSPPAVGDRLYAAAREGGSRKEGKVVSSSEAKDSSRLLRINLLLEPGTGLYNSRGELVAIVRVSGKSKSSGLAVFTPQGMPGDWVEYFPSRVGEPIKKKPVEKMQ